MQVQVLPGQPSKCVAASKRSFWFVTEGNDVDDLRRL